MGKAVPSKRRRISILFVALLAALILLLVYLAFQPLSVLADAASSGVYDGSDKEERRRLEDIMRERYRQSAKEICNAFLDYAVKKDEGLGKLGKQDPIDDNPVFIIKRN